MDGYALLRGAALGLSTERFAADMGDAMAPWGGSLVQVLTPKAEATPNTYSGIFGLGRFPFHTDLAHWPMPPRYLLLRCVRGYADVPTLLLDGRALAAAVGEDAMERALAKPRRPLGGEMRMLRLLQDHAVGEIIRWDQIFLTPASPVGKSVFDQFQRLVDRAVHACAVMADDGDVLVIDNWRMLHARPAIEPDRMDRHLERVYLESLR